MKITTSILVCATLFASWQAASAQETVGSLNIRGIQTVDLPDAGNFAMMSLPFDMEDNSLQTVFGETLQGNAAVAAADKLRFWDSENSRYASVAMGPDGVFYRLNDQGHWQVPLEPVNFSIPLGEGFWVTAGANSSSGRMLTFDGDVVLDPEVSISFQTGFQMVSYPFAAEVHLQDTQLSQDGTGDASVGGADRIQVWNAQTRNYDSYGLAQDKVWYRLNASGNWVAPLEEADHVFKPGQAFFYFARNAFTWVEDNPYASSAFAD